MKILYVTHGLPPDKLGGIETHVEQLARGLAAEDEVEVLIPTEDPSIPWFECRRSERDGFTLLQARVKRDGFRFENLYWNRKIDGMFEQLLLESKPDLVHFHSLIQLSFGMMDVAKNQGIAVIASCHDFYYSCPLGQRIRRDQAICPELDRARCEDCLSQPGPGEDGAGFLAGPLRWGRSLAYRWIKAPGLDQLTEQDRRMRQVLASLDALITPSEFARERLLDYVSGSGLDKAKTHVIPYGLDKGAFEQQEPKSRDPGPVRIGYIGTLIPTKGIEVLIEAFKGLDEGEAHLEIHGAMPEGAENASLRQRLEALAPSVQGEVPAIRIHGRYLPEEVGGILARLDILVVPSIWYETWCITIREGFLAGIPVIASRLGAMEEAIQDGVDGLLFEAGNAGDLRSKLRMLMEDPALGARLVAAPKTISNADTCRSRIRSLYEATLSARDS